MKVNNTNNLPTKVTRFDELEAEIPKTAEFIENKRINIIKVPKHKKGPREDAWQEKQYNVDQLKRHYGNFGVHVGFYHDSGSSIACVDIDGFKYASVPENLKRMLPADKRAYFDSLNAEELDRICQESKDYLFKCLVDLLPSPLVSKSANNGYHFFIFNKTLQTKPEYASGELHRYISRNLVFGEDCPIEELRGLHLMHSIEIFTHRGRQVILPSSFVNEKGTKGAYKRIDDPKFANSWETIGTVEDLAKTVKDGLMEKGLKWDPIDEIPSEQPAHTKTSYNNSFNYNNSYVNNNTNLIELDQIEDDDRLYLARKVGKLYELTIKKNYHNTLGVSVSNGLKSQKLSDDVILSIIGMGLQLKHKEHYEEHFKQVKADLKSTTVKKTGFPTLIKDYPELEPPIIEIKVKIKKIKAKLEKGKKEEKEEKYNADLDDRVKLRKNPSKLVNLEDAKALESELKEMGLINWLRPLLAKIYVGDIKNILRKLLASFNVMRGAGSYFYVTRGEAGAGKTMEDMTVLNYLIPELYVIKMNKPSCASFARDGLLNSEYYNRTLLYVGDLGAKDDLEEFKELANIYKVLISEKFFNKQMVDSSQKFNIKINLKVESCACLVSIVKDDEKVIDSQIESRALSFTPTDNDEAAIIDFKAKLSYKNSPQYKAREEAIKELKRFKNYLLYKVCSEAVILNPWYTGLLKRMSEAAPVPVRHVEQLDELFKAYCILTSYEAAKLQNGEYLGTEAQAKAFFENIALESAVRPDVYKFLLLLKNGTSSRIKGEYKPKEGYNLKLIHPDGGDHKYSDLNTYFNEIMEDDAMKEICGGRIVSFYDLEPAEMTKFLKKLMEKFSLKKDKNGNALGSVFFTVSHVRNFFRKSPGLTNLSDVGTVLYELTKGKKPYLGKLDEHYKGKTVYYGLDSLEDIGKPFKITSEDRQMVNTYLSAVLDDSNYKNVREIIKNK